MVGSRSTTITKNRAVRNGGLGIQAVEGVIDGGGNRASGNGDPRQCVNVACRNSSNVSAPRGVLLSPRPEPLIPGETA